MSIKLRCYCGQAFRAPENRLGKRVRCPRCERIVRIYDRRKPARKTPPDPPPISASPAVQAVFPQPIPTSPLPPPPPPAVDLGQAIEPLGQAAIAGEHVERAPSTGSLADLLEQELLARERIEGPAAVIAKSRRAARGQPATEPARLVRVLPGAVVLHLVRHDGDRDVAGATSREGLKLVVLLSLTANLVCPTIVFIAWTFQWARTMMFPDVDLLWYFLVPFYQTYKVWQHHREMPISTRIWLFAGLIWITSGVFLGLAMTSPTVRSILQEMTDH